MEGTPITVQPLKLSFDELKTMFGINSSEHFDANMVCMGKSPSGKPILRKITMQIEYYA